MGPSTIHVLHLASAHGAAACDVDRIFHTCRGLENHAGTREFRGSVAIIRSGRGRGAYSDAGRVLGVDCYEARRFGPCDPTLWFRLGRLIRRLQVDIVHTYDRESRFWALVLQPRFRFRTIAKAFEPEATTWTERLSREIDHKLLPGFDRVIAANAQLATQLCQLGCRIQQIDVIPELTEEVQAEFRARASAVLRKQLLIPAGAKVAALYLEGTTRDEVRVLAEAMCAAGKESGLYSLAVGPDIERTEVRAVLLASGLSPRLRMYDIGDRLIGLGQAVDLFVSAGKNCAAATLEVQNSRAPAISFSSPGVAPLEITVAVTQALQAPRSGALRAVPEPSTGLLLEREESTDRLVHAYRKAMLV